MDLGPINSNNKFLNKPDKSQKSAQSSGTDNVDSGKDAKSSSSLSDGDKLQLTNLSSSDEIRFARTVLQNLQSLSFDQLSEVRERIEQGEFNTSEVTEKVSSEVASQITFLESVANADSSTEASNQELSSEEISDDLRQKLTNNEEVLNSISNRLLDSLLNL